jgi:hypothetical protein
MLPDKNRIRHAAVVCLNLLAIRRRSQNLLAVQRNSLRRYNLLAVQRGSQMRILSVMVRRLTLSLGQLVERDTWWWMRNHQVMRLYRPRHSRLLRSVVGQSRSYRFHGDLQAACLPEHRVTSTGRGLQLRVAAPTIHAA